MNIFKIRKTGLVLLCGMLSACIGSGPATAGSLQEIDTTKLVSIGGSITEIIFALGEEKRLIGRDSTSVFPEAALKIPDVGYMRALSPEGVLSLGPTAVLAIEGSGPATAVDVLKKAGTPVIWVEDQFSADGIARKIRTIGTALGVPDKAQSLALSVSDDIHAAEDAARKHEIKKRVLFLLSYRDGKITAAGANTAADAMIRMAGGINSMEDFDGYKAVSPEALLTARPDAILMMDNGGNHDVAIRDVLADPALALTPAGKAGTLIRMDGEYLLGFGPRTATAVRDLSARLYGDGTGN